MLKIIFVYNDRKNWKVDTFRSEGWKKLWKKISKIRDFCFVYSRFSHFFVRASYVRVKCYETTTTKLIGGISSPPIFAKNWKIIFANIHVIKQMKHQIHPILSIEYDYGEIRDFRPPSGLIEAFEIWAWRHKWGEK